MSSVSDRWIEMEQQRAETQVDRGLLIHRTWGAMISGLCSHCSANLAFWRPSGDLAFVGPSAVQCGHCGLVTVVMWSGSYEEREYGHQS
jgi:hypothetical protein